MIKMDIEFIKQFDPCASGLENLIKHYPKFNYTMVYFLQLEHIPYDDKIWLACKVVDVSILKQWSVECAEKVVYNYNKVYPNDTRITDCIETTKRYLLGECSLGELQAARSAAESAAWSARSAARYAAESAARSAWSAARSAARYAAESAARSAWSAARSAARSAAESAESAWSARSAAWSAARSAAWSAESAAWSEEETLNLSILISLLENE